MSNDTQHNLNYDGDSNDIIQTGCLNIGIGIGIECDEANDDNDDGC